MAERLWWLDDPKERYWVETLSERRASLGRQLHAPQVDGASRPNWRYNLVSATRPGDVVLHWLNDRGTRGYRALRVQALQQEQVLARLVVIGGHQHLPVTGDDQTLWLVELFGQGPDVVDLDQAVIGV
jgi:hypothetical protein